MFLNLSYYFSYHLRCRIYYSVMNKHLIALINPNIETLKIERNDTSESKDFDLTLKAIECKRAVTKESHSFVSLG